MSRWKPYALALPMALTTALAAPAAPAPRTASLHDRISAVEQWAVDAPILAVVEIEMAEAHASPQAPGATTEAVVRVTAVLRDDLDSGVMAGDRVWMELPGGALPDRMVFSSSAPMLFEGDTVLARLDLGDDGLTFTGINDVLPVADDAVRACVNPSPEGVDRCDGEGAALLPLDHAPLFSAPDLALEIPLQALANPLR